MQNKFFESSILEEERYLIKPTGRQRYGLDEYVYIGQLQMSQPDRSATGFFKILLHTGTDESGLKEFDLFLTPQANKGWFSYYIKDGLGFKTLDGKPVYAQSENGEILTELIDVKKPVLDEQGNEQFSADGNLITEIVQEERNIELLKMFTNSMRQDLSPVTLTQGEALAYSMFGTIMKKIYGNNNP